MLRKILTLYWLFAVLVAGGLNALMAQDEHMSYKSENGKITVSIDNLQDTELLNSLLQKVGSSKSMTDSLFNSVGKALTSLGWELVSYDNYKIVYEKVIGELISDGYSKFFFDDDGKPPYDLDVKFGVNSFKKKSVITGKNDQVIFMLSEYSNANSVYLSGSFNNWETSSTVMKKVDGVWTTSLELDEGKHLYKFIVEGSWITDPANALKEVDRHGNTNSVFYKYNHTFRLNGHQNAKKVYLAGVFNEWEPRELKMNKVNGGWELPVYLEEGMHTYKFIVDGKWMADPDNPVILVDAENNQNSRVLIGKPFNFRTISFPNAQRVVLSGEFNGWNEAELNMTKEAGGWSIPIVLKPGNYQYKFIVDGNWKVDPDNLHQIGPVDARNSVMAVNANHTFVLDGYDNAREVLLSGTFNNWAEDGYIMEHTGEKWIMQVYLPKGKTRYKFIVDGTWIIDPKNRMWENNTVGTKDSFLWVE